MNVKKAAFFVEGKTEQALLEQFLFQMATTNDLRIDLQEALRLGSSSSVARSAYSSVDDEYSFWVLIYNSGSDERATTVAREQIDELAARGFTLVAVVRDVYPLKPSQLDSLNEDFVRLFSGRTMRAQLVLATMEIESWYLAEHTHFLRISNQITYDRIRRSIGEDIREMNTDSHGRPSAAVSQIYAIGGCRYRKGARKATKTLAALDFAFLYLDAPRRSTSLSELIALLDDFFTLDDVG